MKLLEENIVVGLHHLGLGNDFLDTETCIIHLKKIEMNFIKIKNLCASKRKALFGN